MVSLKYKKLGQENVCFCVMGGLDLNQLKEEIINSDISLPEVIYVEVDIETGLDLKYLLQDNIEMVKNDVTHTLKFYYYNYSIYDMNNFEQVYYNFFEDTVMIVKSYIPDGIDRNSDLTNVLKFESFEEFKKYVQKMPDQEHILEPDFCYEGFLDQGYMLVDLIRIYNSLIFKGIKIDAEYLLLFTNNNNNLKWLQELNHNRTKCTALRVASIVNAEYNRLFVYNKKNDSVVKF